MGSQILKKKKKKEVLKYSIREVEMAWRNFVNLFFFPSGIDLLWNFRLSAVTH